MTHFEEYGYEIVENAINVETANLLAIQMEMHHDVSFYQKNIREDNKFALNDDQITNCFSSYSFIGFESLLLLVKPKLELVTKKQLLPAYSYARIYYKGAEMAIHTDRPSCQYSATMTISIDETPWDIWFMDNYAITKNISLPVGHMCVYRGDKLPHWREKYNGNKQIQVFLHYVDANGEYKENIYDGRPMLGSPELPRSITYD
jgi:hypothetical protein